MASAAAPSAPSAASAPPKKKYHGSWELYPVDHRHGARAKWIWNHYSRKHIVYYLDEKRTIPADQKEKKPERPRGTHLKGICNQTRSDNLNALWSHHIECPHVTNSEKRVAIIQYRKWNGNKKGGLTKGATAIIKRLCPPKGLCLKCIFSSIFCVKTCKSISMGFIIGFTCSMQFP